jgi:hypothetical protein
MTIHFEPICGLLACSGPQEWSVWRIGCQSASRAEANSASMAEQPCLYRLCKCHPRPRRMRRTRIICDHGRQHSNALLGLHRSSEILISLGICGTPCRAAVPCLTAVAIASSGSTRSRVAHLSLWCLDSCSITAYCQTLSCATRSVSRLNLLLLLAS